MGLATVATAEQLAARARAALEAGSRARAALEAGSRARAALEAGSRVAPTALAADQLLPVSERLAPAFPNGLRRGTTVAVSGQGKGASTLALSLLAQPTALGSWAAAVGLPDLGLVAAREIGVALDRLALVPTPMERWAEVIAAFVEAVDIVLVGLDRTTVKPVAARRLTARARERGCTLVVLDPGARWPEPPEVRLTAGATRWWGIGTGHGHLSAREVDVVVGGRRAASRERMVTIGFDSPGPERPFERTNG